jgi:uncharacterized membrane protein YcjF (UPF0283 family)
MRTLRQKLRREPKPQPSVMDSSVKDIGDKRKSVHEKWSERVAAGLLLAVLAAVGWMISAAFWPDSLRLGSLAAEVIALIVLLTLALVGMSIVALIHTRER